MVKRQQRRKALTPAQRKEVKAMTSKTLKTNTEKKFKFDDFQLFAGDTGAVTRLDGIAVGVDSDERIGREIRYSELELRMRSIYADDVCNLVRVLIFIWKEESTPSVAQILNIGTQNTVPYLANYNPTYMKNYHILSDKVMDVTKSGIACEYKKYTKRWKNGLPSRFVGDVATSLSTNNNLFLLCITDSGVIPHPTLDVAYKLSFMDV